jgi:hypothetical protein
MVDDVADIALWDSDGISDQLEDELPLPEDLRQRIKSWVHEYTDSITFRRSWTADEYLAFDRRGYAMSLELQDALGPDYRIEYVFETEEVAASRPAPAPS